MRTPLALLLTAALNGALIVGITTMEQPRPDMAVFLGTLAFALIAGVGTIAAISSLPLRTALRRGVSSSLLSFLGLMLCMGVLMILDPPLWTGVLLLVPFAFLPVLALGVQHTARNPLAERARSGPAIAAALGGFALGTGITFLAFLGLTAVLGPDRHLTDTALGIPGAALVLGFLLCLPWFASAFLHQRMLPRPGVATG